MENELLKSLDKLNLSQQFAVGNDLVFVPDFKASFNDLFKKKVYTAAEVDYCDQFADSLLHYASTWAAKEAVYKAAKQIDPATLGWNKIEITHDKTGGKPNAIIHTNKNTFKISLTISHDGDYAWAIALIELNA